MALPTMFCPQCDTLILDAEQCSSCHWRRLQATGEVGKPAWAVALEAKLPGSDSRPLAAGHALYIPTDLGQIVAVDTLAAQSENAVTWRYTLDAHCRCFTVAVWGDYLLLGNEYTGGLPAPPGELILLTAGSGEEAWRLSVEGASLSVPIVREDMAYFTVNSGRLCAVDLAKRQLAWQQEVSAPWSWAPSAPALTPTNLLLLTGRSDRLVAFDIEARDIAWTFSAEDWFLHTSVWVDGLIYARCRDRHIYAIEAASGREVWRHRPGRDPSSDLWVSSSYVYIGVKDDQGGADQGSEAYALYTLDRQTGERVGRYEVNGHIVARPVATDEAVFFATDDRSQTVESQGTFYALDASGQQLLWEPCVVEQRFQSDLLLLDDWVIAGTRQGAIYGIPWRTVETEPQAPQVYIDQGDWEKAAIAYAWLGDYQQAAELYAQRLNQPLRAAQLYLYAGQYREVIERWGPSEIESERQMAVKAAQHIPDLHERAQILSDLQAYTAAGHAYVEAGELEKAGDCYLAAQVWPEARAAFAHAHAWDKWEQVTRELQLWEELIERFLAEGDYAQAAEVQLGRGLYLEAAQYYDRAGLLTEALAAYRRVNPAHMTREAQYRVAELAEILNEMEVALEAYRALNEFSKAAHLAEVTGLYNQAVTLYQAADEGLKAAEILENFERHADAADLFEQANIYGRAALNLERQVEQEIERFGGISYVPDDRRIETWLERAIRLFEKEADYADEESRQAYYQGADRCREGLMRARREPVLQLDIQADGLAIDQSNEIHYKIENVGWGTARQLILTISGSHLRDVDRFEFGELRRGQKHEGVLTMVPTLAGQVKVQIELRAQAENGELRELITPVVSVAQQSAEGGPGLSFSIRIGHGAKELHSKDALLIERGAYWNTGSDSDSDTRPVSPLALKKESLRRELTDCYTNLNTLKEQAAIYGAGQSSLHILNQIKKQQQAIAKIEEKLRALNELE